jgi:hypothetical protein
VVAVTLEHRRPWFPAADRQRIRFRLDADAHLRQLLLDRVDAVALLHAQLGDASDLGEPVRERGRNREHGDLVDHPLVGLDRGGDERRGLDLEAANRLAEALPRRYGHNVRAHASEHLDETQTARVEAYVLDHDRRARCDARSHREQRGR